ncbi:MAG TPA: prolyl oligopeptidase family serine peptidase [Verrucomicrobiota bacterium]|nr:prolyl oligopeptidase family serine peptidase [Verrucomicrobiota bacterium]HNT16191.1 prolyl oligopeptidase family serine peptidase [Verrucomicrobiota bacterium]
MKSCFRFPLALLLLVAAMSVPAETNTRITTATFQWQTSHHGTWQYLQYLPPGYDPAGSKKWPLMLFLHGAGERGSDVHRVAIHGPLHHVQQGQHFPFIIVAPLCPANQLWKNEPLLALLDHLVATHRVDEKRIYLTGLSMGGYGTWNLGIAHPERFAAIAPICGGANMIDVMLGTWDKKSALQQLPIWAFHGAEDEVVPVTESERVVNALKKGGVKNIRLTIYPQTKHDSWKPAYADPGFYEWLLKQSR